jgi:hypothetical protein
MHLIYDTYKRYDGDENLAPVSNVKYRFPFGGVQCERRNQFNEAYVPPRKLYTLSTSTRDWELSR